MKMLGYSSRVFRTDKRVISFSTSKVPSPSAMWHSCVDRKIS